MLQLGLPPYGKKIGTMQRGNNRMAEKLDLLIEEMRTTMLFDHESKLVKLRELSEQISICDDEIDREIDAIIDGLASRRTESIGKLHRIMHMLETYPTNLPPPMPQQHQAVDQQRFVTSKFDPTQDIIDEFASIGTAAA